MCANRHWATLGRPRCRVYIQDMASSTVFDTRQGPSKINADLQEVAHQVHTEFDACLDPLEVDECLHRVASQFEDATVRAFVPLLVRRYVRDELRARVCEV